MVDARRTRWEAVGPEDDEGLRPCRLLRGGVVVGVMGVWRSGGHALVVGPAGPTGPAGAVDADALLGAWFDGRAMAGDDGVVRRVTHRVPDGDVGADLLAAWARRAEGRSAVVVGEVGGRRCPYDPARWVPGGPTSAVTVTWDPSLAAVGDVEAPQDADVDRWFADPDPFLRLFALRRLGLDPAVDADVVGRAHDRALLDHHAALRQFAALAVSGFDAALSVRPDLERLLARCRDPLDGVDLAGVDAADRAHTRRNARYAVLWALMNLARRAALPDPPAAVRELVARLRPHLAGPADGPWAELAAAELRGDGPARFGIGAVDVVELAGLLRYAGVRAAAFTAAGREEDVFHWLAGAAREVAGLGGAAPPPAPPIHPQSSLDAPQRP